ncbi:hypothetical protein LOK49_LG03G01929 [Camellia lanceoleosa]|uniref:Uncharacterized protein n=1 Tax=Camellia lanceoleosa TaxID=1840588 RepID=A0ACC0I9V3_9ERIC|nr:hypothetical protein LOK49_LG03G01929 [Camellia lanceoleosa]
MADFEMPRVRRGIHGFEALRDLPREKVQLATKFGIVKNGTYSSCGERELRIAILPYFPTAHGFFAGKAVVESVPTDSFLCPSSRLRGLEYIKVLLVSRIFLRTHHCQRIPIETRACLDVFQWCQVQDIRVLSQIAYGWSNCFVVHHHAIGPHNR